MLLRVLLVGKAAEVVDVVAAIVSDTCSEEPATGRPRLLIELTGCWVEEMGVEVTVTVAVFSSESSLSGHW
jgi:hypothetical protein